VFVVGFPVTITLGLIVLVFSIPFMFSLLTRIFIDLSHNIMGLLKVGVIKP